MSGPSTAPAGRSKSMSYAIAPPGSTDAQSQKGGRFTLRTTLLLERLSILS